MTSESNGFQFLPDFASAVQRLRQLTIIKNPSDHTPFEHDLVVCPMLIKVIENFSLTAKATTIKVDERKVLTHWNALKAMGTTTDTTPRELRRFFWTPEIVFDIEFQRLLEAKIFPISLSSLRGLLYSYHQRYLEQEDSHGLSTLLRTGIKERASASANMRLWNDRIECIVGPLAARNLSNIAAASNWVNPEVLLDQYGLHTTTAFAHKFGSNLAQLGADHFNSDKGPSLNVLLDGLLRSPLVERHAYKGSISTVILSERAGRNEEIQTQLIDHLLSSNGIGDPRITPENWVGVTAEAKERVIQWLSKEDIKFFFELLLRDKDDKHGRKKFWLQFANKVTRSRALISKDDYVRHAVRLQELTERGRSYGEISGSSSASAFILDFGRIVIVEFSEVGNACYVYEKSVFEEKIFKNFWAAEGHLSLLKNKLLAVERILHCKDWQTPALHSLARFGVRRG